MSHYQSALITGASSGIGRALAIACAAPGVVLHLGGRDAARLSDTAAACRSRGAEAHARSLDVTDAGGTGRAHAETPEQTRAIFAVNVDGVLNTVLPAIPAMAAQTPDASGVRGRIAVVASIAA